MADSDLSDNSMPGIILTAGHAYSLTPVQYCWSTACTYGCQFTACDNATRSQTLPYLPTSGETKTILFSNIEACFPRVGYLPLRGTKGQMVQMTRIDINTISLLAAF